MTLTPGTRLGPYELVELIGAGGMGVVYRARDLLLHRSVAIKLVGTRHQTSPEEHARLMLEARAASALNHPHICTVYEVGEFEGLPFIAMEYLEGRPLAEVVPHDGLPPQTVIRYGIQIADALAHAHGRGVIHRDLKTANIVLNADGAPKILDFGLARRVEPRGSETATASVGLGEAAALAGTLAYVAPEALLGRPADALSDIWSLGVVMYELATGHQPFTGQTSFELTAAILRAAPDPFPRHVSPSLRTVITRCLTKEPAQRYKQAGEVRAALEAIASDVSALGSVSPRKRTRWLAVAGVIAIAGAVGGVWQFLRQRGPDWEQFAAERRLSRLTASEAAVSDPALSPDGRMVCYIQKAADDRTDLYVGRIAGTARIRLTNDEAVERAPRFSPDGEYVAFTSLRAPDQPPEVHVVPSLGGETVHRIRGGASPAWSPDGTHLVYVRRDPAGSTLVVSDLDGVNPRVILPADSVYLELRNPSWSPDGQHVAVVRGTGGAAGEIWIVPAQGGAPRRLLDEPAATFSDSPMFTTDGRGIVHASNRGGATNIWVLPIDGGAPVRLTTGPGPDESPSVAADGSIAFLNSRTRGLLQAFDDSGGTPRTLAAHTPFLWGPAISPDGLEVAFARSEVDGSWHVWSVPLAGGTPRRLTSGDGGELYPRWSHDSAFIVFHTWSVPRRFGRVGRGGGTTEWLAFGGENYDGFADLSPDGRSVAFARADAQTERVYIAPFAGGASRLLTPSAGTVPRWSPDGTRIAFSGSRYIVGGIFTIDADGKNQRQITHEGGWPVWWPDGRQLGYLALDANGNQQLRVVPAEGGTPRALTHVKLRGVNHPFAIAPDGRTIVVSNSEHVSDEIWLLTARR